LHNIAYDMLLSTDYLDFPLLSVVYHLTELVAERGRI